MTYRFLSRLRHVANRANQVNAEVITYIRGATSREMSASPILMEAVEIIPGLVATRIEYQDWAIDVVELEVFGGVPVVGDKIVRSTGEEFLVSSRGMVTQDITDPPYRFATSDRDRVIAYTNRVKGSG